MKKKVKKKITYSKNKKEIACRKLWASTVFSQKVLLHIQKQEQLRDTFEGNSLPIVHKTTLATICMGSQTRRGKNW